MAGTDALDRARNAYSTRAWSTAYENFRDAQKISPLIASDLEKCARAAYLIGADEDCVGLLGQAFQQRQREGGGDAAGDDAFWLAFHLLMRGEFARAGGWLARANGVTAGHGPDCPVRAKVLAISALQKLRKGDATGALGAFGRAQEVGRRGDDAELLAMAGLGIGQAKIAMGEVAAGLVKLDEVMVAVTAGEVSPVMSGIVYCAVVVACHNSYQPQRAAEWTRALSRWCDDQPDLVLFRGDCLVHRAQILAFNGAWHEAMVEVSRARHRLANPPRQAAIGSALYEQAELHRLRGETAAAEDGYRRANEFGHETQPGLALLRLGQGRADAAWTGVRRVLEEAGKAWERPRLLAAAVQIAIERHDVAGARTASDDLARIATSHDSELLSAMSAHAMGAVLLAEGRTSEALSHLRTAWQLWCELDAPYECARVRVLQGRCCRQFGDDDAAEMEFHSAAEVFRELGAKPELVELEELGMRAHTADTRALTRREVQVLRTVATGLTNRAIAEELFLSEKTVARHLSNIFTKLGVSSRSAATAYAYEHELL